MIDALGFLFLGMDIAIFGFLGVMAYQVHFKDKVEDSETWKIIKSFFN